MYSVAYTVSTIFCVILCGRIVLRAPFYGLERNGNGYSVTNAGVPHAFNKSWPQGRTGRGHGNYRAARQTVAAALGRRPCLLVVKTTLFANGVLRVVLLRGRGAKGKFRLPCRT